MDNYIIGLLPTIEPKDDMKIAVGNSGGFFSITIGELKEYFGSKQNESEEVSLQETNLKFQSFGFDGKEHKLNSTLLVNGNPIEPEYVTDFNIILGNDSYKSTPKLSYIAGDNYITVTHTSPVNDGKDRTVQTKDFSFTFKYKGKDVGVQYLKVSYI